MKIVTKENLIKYANYAAELNGKFLQVRLTLITIFDQNYIDFLQKKHMSLQSTVSTVFMKLSTCKDITERAILIKKIENLLQEYEVFVSGLQTTVPCFKGNVR